MLSPYSCRLTSSTPAVWQLVPRVVLKNVNTSLLGTAGIVLRELCSCPAMVDFVVVRKALTSVPGTPGHRLGPLLLYMLNFHPVSLSRTSLF